jgi:hypothetical protein
MNSPTRNLAILGALLLPTACAAAPTPKPIHFLQPPKIELPAFESIGVAAIEGSRAQDLESALIRALTDEDRGLGLGQKITGSDPVVVKPDHFRLADRGQLTDAIGETPLTGGLQDQSTKSAVERLLGAGILLTGTLSEPSVDDDWGDAGPPPDAAPKLKGKSSLPREATQKSAPPPSKSTKAPEPEPEPEEDDKEDGEKICLKRTVEVRFDLRVIEATTGAIVHAATYDEKKKDRECSKDGYADVQKGIKSVDTILQKAWEKMSEDIANDIAPYWHTFNVSLETNKDSKEGVQLFTKQDNLPDAAAWFVAAADASPYDEWRRYNAAVLLTAMYRFDDAQEQLDKARGIRDHAQRYNHVGKLIQTLRGDVERFEEMGIDFPAMGLPTKSATGHAIGGRMVTVKGSRKKMITLMSEAGSGDVVTQVPGGLKLSVLADTGEWLQVQTYDGKVGWLSAKAVK